MSADRYPVASFDPDAPCDTCGAPAIVAVAVTVADRRWLACLAHVEVATIAARDWLRDQVSADGE